MHGKARRRNASEFGVQLAEKQKVRYTYGITDTVLRRIFGEAVKAAGRTNEALMQLLERRLDNVVFRAGFAVSRSIARHIVSHGHILVNGQRVTVPSYRVRPGDQISIRVQSRESPLFADLLNRIRKYEPPAWIELDREGRQAIVKALPATGQVSEGRDMSLVVEFYSR
jgi:small subunit ribosomal protein S4